jgi:hypothetical protein
MLLRPFVLPALLAALLPRPAVSAPRPATPAPSKPAPGRTAPKKPTPAPAPPRRPAPEIVGVLLYDGKLPEQVALEQAVRAAFQPHAPRVELRTLHAGTADAVPFLKRFDLTRRNAPLFLQLDEPGPRARIKRRVPLRPDDDPRRSIRIILATLKLPLPRVEIPKPGVLTAIAADGGPGEAAQVVTLAGPQRVEAGARVLDTAAFAAYRLPIPEALRRADLRADAGGAFALDWADEPQGPWRPLMSTRAHFSGAEERFRERLKPVVNLDSVLEQLPGNLYVRFRGLGRSPATLVKLELVARGPTEPSGEAEWLAAVEALRERHAATLPPDALKGTLIGGRLEKDRVLLAADSPFVLTGDLIVPFGRRLTLEPGVTVKSAGRFVIRVQGDLIARGTPAAPILFTPAAPRQPDDWGGIEFLAPRGYYAGAGSALAHCRVLNAAVGLDLRRFSGEISAVTFENCLLGVRLADGGKGRLTHSRFTRCQRGLLVDGGAGEVQDNLWTECLIALAVSEVHAQMPFRFERNSIQGSVQAAVFYPRSPSHRPPPLALPGNHWTGTPEALLIGGGSAPEDVRLDPRLPIAPPGVGP